VKLRQHLYSVGLSYSKLRTLFSLLWMPSSAGDLKGHVAGLANERMGNLEAAMEYHEKHRELQRLSGKASLRHTAAFPCWADYARGCRDVQGRRVTLGDTWWGPTR
jgi:hypothetical protein